MLRAFVSLIEFDPNKFVFVFLAFCNLIIYPILIANFFVILMLLISFFANKHKRIIGFIDFFDKTCFTTDTDQLLISVDERSLK